MDSLEIGNLRSLVAIFTAAIRRADPKRLMPSLRRFPFGSCGDASLLLARFLTEAGSCGATYVSGLRGNCTHAWLEVEDLIIDITACQFAADPEAVRALERLPTMDGGILVTTNRDWHSQFEETRRHIARIDIYDESTNQLLENSYREIRSHLNIRNK